MQHGGFGVLGHDTLIRAHAGEGFLFTGMPWRADFGSMFAQAAGVTNNTDSHANTTNVFNFYGPIDGDLRRKLLSHARSGL